MVKVPTYQSRVPVPDAPAGPRVDPGAFARAGQGLMSAGADLRDTAQIVRRSDEHAATQEAARAVAETRAAWVERGHEMEQAAPEGAPGFVKQLTTAFDKDAQQRLEKASPLAREIIGLNMIGVRRTLVSRALAFETTSRLNKQLRDLDTTLTAETNSARLDDTLFGQAFANGRAAIAASQMPEDNKAAATVAFTRDIAKAVYQGTIERDPERAKAMLENGEFKAALRPGDLQVLVRAADARIEENRRLAAADLAPRLKDHIASIQASGVGLPGVEQQAAKLLKPDRLAAFRADAKVATDYHDAFETMKFAPPERIAATLTALQPKPGTEGFAERQRLYETLARGVEQMAKARDKDPAGYAMANPRVRAAFEAAAAGDDPAAASRAYRARMEFQASMGVARPSVLSQAEAKETVAQVQSMPPSDVAGRLVSMFRGYGPDLAPKALAELSAAGLDTRYQVLATIADDPVASAALSASIGAGSAEIKKTLDPADTKTLRDTVRTLVKDFRQVVESADATGMRAQKMNAYASAIEDTALGYMRQGKTAEAAARDAYDAVIGDRYHVLRSGSVRAYVPKMAAGRQTDPRAVEAAAADLQTEAKIRAFDPLPFGDPASPGRFMDIERTVRTAVNSGFWANDETGTGLVLMVPFRGGGVLPLVDKQGVPYRMAFSDAIAFAAQISNQEGAMP